MRARLAAIIDSSDDAIIGLNLQGRITSWNASAERIFGYRAAEAVGRRASMLLPGMPEGEVMRTLARVQAGEEVSQVVSLPARTDGRSLNVSLTVSPIKSARGRVIGVSTVARDITDYKRAEHELERLAQVAEEQFGRDHVV